MTGGTEIVHQRNYNRLPRPVRNELKRIKLTIQIRGRRTKTQRNRQPERNSFSGTFCLNARKQLSRQRVVLASLDNSDTHDSNGGRGRRGRRGSGGRVTSHIGAIGRGPEPAESQATQWRTGDVARRRRWRTGAGGHRGSPQSESWTNGGAARAQTRRAGVYAPLDWDNLHLGVRPKMISLDIFTYLKIS